MAARKPTAKRQPKKKSADATAEVPAGQETGTTQVERSRSTDGANR